jgi:hypothetical protein
VFEGGALGDLEEGEEWRGGMKMGGFVEYRHVQIWKRQAKCRCPLVHRRVAQCVIAEHADNTKNLKHKGFDLNVLY